MYLSLRLINEMDGHLCVNGLGEECVQYFVSTATWKTGVDERIKLKYLKEIGLENMVMNVSGP